VAAQFADPLFDAEDLEGDHLHSIMATVNVNIELHQSAGSAGLLIFEQRNSLAHR
jgi:hypothetical protein